MAALTQLSDADFEAKALGSGKLTLIDFGAAWCGPCKALAPVVEELAGELGDRVDFYAVDIGEAPEAAASLGIMSVPTIVLLKAGEELDRSVGFVPKSRLKAFVEGHLV